MNHENYRDMDRYALMELGVGISDASRRTTPLFFYGVDNGNEGSGLRTSNIGCLYVDLRMHDGKHVASYRLGWHTDNGQDHLELGDGVSYELAIVMYQELLFLITNAHPSTSYITRTLLEQEI